MFYDGNKAKSAAEKKHHVETNNLCLNCLGKHKLSECISQKTCSSCRARHHTTLHDVFTERIATTLNFSQQSSRVQEKVLLLARVLVKDLHGEFHNVRALIDQTLQSYQNHWPKNYGYSIFDFGRCFRSLWTSGPCSRTGQSQHFTFNRRINVSSTSFGLSSIYCLHQRIQGRLTAVGPYSRATAC